MRPRAHILTVGNEVLKGTVLNTNARFLGRELTGLGFEVTGQSSCRDVIPEIRQSIGLALAGAELVILSGGLGPTPDDLTREAVSEYFDKPLKFSSRQYKFIQGYYRKHKKKVPPLVRKEAMFPSGSKPLFNRVGIALGFQVWQNGKMTVVLPGVPMELEKMFHALVVPEIHSHFPSIAKRFSLIVRTVGLSEPRVMENLGKSFFRESFDFGIYPHPGETTVRIYAESAGVIGRLKRMVSRRLAGSVYAWNDTPLAQTVGQLLKKKRKTLAVAESCTGGLLSSMITQVPGAGKFFRAGVTVYQTDIKKWIGADPRVLKKGVISAATARELAEKARTTLKSDYGIGITGVAGPEREEGFPVGRVYIAVAGPRKTVALEQDFLGERIPIQIKAAVKSLEMLWKLLTSK